MSSYAATVHEAKAPVTKHFGVAWFSLCAALTIHVADEAATDFLSVYNPTVLDIRSRIPFIPLPTFSFRVWLTGLIVAIVVLFCLTPFAFREFTLMPPLASLFAITMLANGLLHIGGSIYLKRLMPGVYSAPLLVITSLFLLAKARKLRRKTA